MMRTQQQPEVRRLYAAEVADDDSMKLHQELERMRQRIIDLEGMLEAECRGNLGRSQHILDWLDKTRLGPSDGQ